MASIVIALGDPIVRVFGEINNHFFQFNLNGVIERSRWENNPGVISQGAISQLRMANRIRHEKSNWRPTLPHFRRDP